MYPGHTAGSACGKKIGDAPSTTIRAEKMGNYAFQPEERDEFIGQVMADMPNPRNVLPDAEGRQQGRRREARGPERAGRDGRQRRQGRDGGRRAGG